MTASQALLNFLLIHERDYPSSLWAIPWFLIEENLNSSAFGWPYTMLRRVLTVDFIFQWLTHPQSSIGAENSGNQATHLLRLAIFSKEMIGYESASYTSGNIASQTAHGTQLTIGHFKSWSQGFYDVDYFNTVSHKPAAEAVFIMLPPVDTHRFW